MQLVLEAPGLIEDLLERSLGLRLQPHATVERLDATLSEAAPVEYRADGTVAFRDGSGACTAAVVVEVQLRPDREKTFKWPFYLAQVRDRLRCHTDLLVITLDAATANWARQAVRLGHANDFRALVVAPQNLPVIETREAARAEPELAVLALLARAREVSGEVAVSVVEGLSESRLETSRSAYYIDVVRDLLPDVARKALEAGMIPADYVPQSPFSKAVFAAIAEGKEQGKAEGELVALRGALTALLSSLGHALDAREQAKIEACTDAQQLQRWIVRAPHLTSKADLFGQD